VQALTDDMKKTLSKLEMVKSKLTKAEKQRDIMMVADLQYYALPEIEEKLKSLKIDEEKASAALYDQLLDEDSKVFFTNTIGSAQVRKVVEKLTSEGRILPNSNSTFKAAMPVESSEPSATPDLRSELPSSDRRVASSELPNHQQPPELSNTSRTELEGGTARSPQELSDTSKAELEASTPGPRYELATSSIRGKVELESPERHEVPAADVQRRPELEGSWVSDLPELGNGNSKTDGDGEAEKEKEKGRWKGKLKGLISKGK
jgi:hypothetical protein